MHTFPRLTALPLLGGFSGRVHDYRVTLVQALHELLDELLVHNVDDFILSPRALGFT